ncbi:hypothetical protein EPA93_41175 [Ktedonosporobacter rubrisoli]|uniref:Uncharacterized protein n=1 Tax=Ktedonosporobacter rubrisoli TaxID=2509675 RepID=A0A4P6K2H0_KTERU|nr:hypothetical protein [Ktedonosporobacter rubrisoli]QBD82053.1 hypothetical protein EPA93_41175 [Ktedonosporobacter rubrisoli]
MQQFASNPNPNRNSRSRTMLITAITLFALSGLLVGFTVGALNHPSQAQQAQPKKTSSPVAKATKETQPTQATQGKVALGCPQLGQYSTEMVADGSTTYTFAAQAIDKSIDSTPPCGHGKPIQNSGITCRLWLSSPKGVSVPNDVWTNPAALSQPLPNEVQGALAFDPSTPQVQPCQNGKGQWKFTVSPQVDHGSYVLAVLTDWEGTYANWSWTAPIKVKTANN